MAPTPVSFDESSSTRQPCSSANRWYMRKRSEANRPASSPPVPARISSTTFFSSLGSFGSSSTLIEPSSVSRRASRGSELLLGQLAQVVVVAGGQLAGLGQLVDDRLVLAELLDQRLNLRQRPGVLAVLLLVGLHRRIADERHQLVVPLLYGLQLVEHDRSASRDGRQERHPRRRRRCGRPSVRTPR